MNVKQLIAALHEAAGGDNSFYDADVIVITTKVDSEIGHQWHEEEDIDEVMQVNSKGKIAFQLGSSWRAFAD